jgi:hypothetical protein
MRSCFLCGNTFRFIRPIVCREPVRQPIELHRGRGNQSRPGSIKPAAGNRYRARTEKAETRTRDKASREGGSSANGLEQARGTAQADD